MLQFIRENSLTLWGVYSFVIGTIMYLIGALSFIPRYFFFLDDQIKPIAEFIVWYSGVPITFGIILCILDIIFLLPRKRERNEFKNDNVPLDKITVALTAFNDEESIGEAIRDFCSHPNVSRVIVVSNNSSDRTMEIAAEAGAIVFNEQRPGYGHCLYRCCEESLKYEDSEVIVLCEGDRTFRAYDIDKLTSYIAHADIVNGTRTVEALRHTNTQLTSFMFYGNLFVGKLLEAKHLGSSTITDVGTTYKACRRDALIALLPHLDPSVNLTFNAHFLDRALFRKMTLVECPITFHPRVGESKGGNVHNRRAFVVGIAMMRGITFGWKGGR